VKRPRLFEPDPKAARPTSSGELVPIDTDRCPVCGMTLERVTIEEAMLFRHGGYGATRRTVRDACRCGWAIVREITEIRPR